MYNISIHSGEEDIRDIIKEIFHVKSNYKAFGMILGLGYAQLECIQKTPLCIVDMGAALTEVVLAWLRQKYNTARFGLPTWRKIVEAIDSEAGGNSHTLAKEIAVRHPGSYIFNIRCIAKFDECCREGN